jgi:hypothetical protein
VGRGNALDFGLGFWSYGWGCRRRGDAPRVCDNYGAFDLVTVNVDYLWQDGIVAGTGASLDWHIGGGGRVGSVTGHLQRRRACPWVWT